MYIVFMNKKKIGKKKIIQIFTTWRFLFFLIWKLPMGFLAKLRVLELKDNVAKVSVPFNYWNKNPFKSIYFAVQAMAAELSTGVLVILHTDGLDISMLVTNLESTYYKKATSRIQFICLQGDKISSCVKKTQETNQPQICQLISKGYDINGVCVSEFKITWSLKKRKQII